MVAARHRRVYRVGPTGGRGVVGSLVPRPSRRTTRRQGSGAAARGVPGQAGSFHRVELIAEPQTESERGVGNPSRGDPGARHHRAGITEPGIDLRFSARADGGFDVSERIILRAPRPRIRLTPPGHAAAGVAFANSRARVRSLQIQTADGQPLAPERLGTFSGATTIPLGAATSALVLRYQLDGTSVRSVPSTAGRALAFIRPLTADVDPTLPVRVSADGPGTLNLSCPQLPVDRRACAQGTAPELRGGTAMTAAESVVVVQLNLPAP